MGGYNNPPYYLSAYSLAVSRGFVGTVDDWLESLKGAGVELRREGRKIQWRNVPGKGKEQEEPWKDLMNMEEIGGEDICHFGWRYAEAEKVFDISAAQDNSVQMYLFGNGDGYDAVVAGEGEMANHPYHYDGNGALVVDLSGREYDASKIFRLHIERGATSIGDLFMYKAFNLKHLSFGDSKAVTHLGAYAFAYTQISGAYDFSGVADDTISNTFEACPKLEGLTFNSNVKAVAKKAFQFCLALKYVDGFKGVTEIGEAAFQYCTCLRWIDLPAGNVKFGSWAFILTPNELTLQDQNITIREIEGWSWSHENEEGYADTSPMWFVQDSWGEQLNPIQEVRPDSVSLSVPETDNQKADMYKGDWRAFWMMVFAGRSANGEPYWVSGRASATGQCGFFCLYHIYNILHPNAPYATYRDFIERRIAPVRLEVSKKMAEDLRNTNAERWAELERLNEEAGTGVTYEAGTTVSATDLPLALDNASVTYGDEGTAFWGVCEALGWKATKVLFEDDNTGATVKERIVQELAAGRPVLMEIVGAGASGHGMHAVTVIGYDKKTDKLQIIDSTWEYPSDIVPMVYWLPFEAMITPDAASAVWTFEFKEVTMTDIEKKMDEIMAAASFKMESGQYVQDADDASGSVAIQIPCTPGAKILIFQADDTVVGADNLTTYARVTADVNKSVTDGDSITKWAVGAHGNCLSKIGNQNNQGMLMHIDKYDLGVYGIVLKVVPVATTCNNQEGFGFNVRAIKAGIYNWKAYYWNE